MQIQSKSVRRQKFEEVMKHLHKLTLYFNYFLITDRKPFKLLALAFLYLRKVLCVFQIYHYY